MLKHRVSFYKKGTKDVAFTNETEVESIYLGEPDGSLFSQYEGLPEKPPSEVVRTIILAGGQSESVAATKAKEMGDRFDQQYHNKRKAAGLE